MIAVIQGIRAQHGTATPESFAARHAAHVAAHRERGMTMTPSDHPLVAHINAGRWVASCACGAGVAIEPTWPDARCFGCGTTYTTIVLPAEDERRAIEGALLRRRRMDHRHWHPHASETAATLRAENAAHPERLGS